MARTNNSVNDCRECVELPEAVVPAELILSFNTHILQLLFPASTARKGLPDNLPRLVALIAKYDPQGRFYSHGYLK